MLLALLHDKVLDTCQEWPLLFLSWLDMAPIETQNSAESEYIPLCVVAERLLTEFFV